jgi:hypothetical protein
VTLKTPDRVPAGKRVKCPKCGQHFTPEPEEKSPPPGSKKPDGAAGLFKFADDPKKPGASPPPPPPPPPFVDDDEEDEESVRKGYGVVGETEQEIEQAKKNKVNFGAVEDKHKKSARGPAIALLVMPSNLLTFEGLVTAIGGVVLFVIGMWPLVFNDAPPGDEEIEEAIVAMLLGLMTFGWGALICFGASQMQELRSYMWAMVGSVMGVLPLLVGIYGIVMLQNPKVKAGFEESEGGPEEDEDDEEDEEDEEDEDDDDEDDEDEDDDDDDE